MLKLFMTLAVSYKSATLIFLLKKAGLSPHDRRAKVLLILVFFRSIISLKTCHLLLSYHLDELEYGTHHSYAGP
jgi:hypothetical protein